MKPNAVVAHQFGDVLLEPGHQIVDADDLVAAVEQPAQRCDPRKPAPPLTTTLIGRPRRGRRTHAQDRGRVKDVAAVDDGPGWQ